MASSTKKQGSELVDDLMGYIGEAFDTGVDAAKGIHQAGVEIPLNILQSVGVSEDLTTSLKEKHEDLIGSVYGSVHSVVSQVGKAGAGQIRLLKEAVLDEEASQPKPRARPKRKAAARGRAKGK